MASSRAVHEVSPDGAGSPTVGPSSITPIHGFSPEGDSVLADLQNPTEQEATRGVESTQPVTAQAQSCPVRPTAGASEEEDASSSISEVTAVGIGHRGDPGTRMQTRAREIEDEISRFCADSVNRITVSARNYIMSRVFELVNLCSDMRADAATERGAALALQGQLVDARREIAGLQRQVLVAERPPVGDILGGLAAAPAVGPAHAVLAAGPGVQVATGATPTGPVVPGAPSYAAVVRAGGPAGISGAGPAGPAGLVGAAPSRVSGIRHEHVAFLTQVGATEAPARDVVRLLKANIDPVAKDIRDVTLRHTRYGVTVFTNNAQTLTNIQNAINENAVTRAAMTIRIPARRNPHVRFSEVDPDLGPEEFLRLLDERNPTLQIGVDISKVKVTFRERGGTKAYVVEVDPEAFRRIMASPRLSVGWTMVHASEDLHVPTCTFCASYGHGRSSCPAAADPNKAVCTKCGTEGHVGAACPVRMGDATVCCAACRRVGLEAAGHPTGFSGCPLLQEKVARLRARTHYGRT
ncbi:hypothetical protein HPB51_026824 [Rhipicephalus microplus]|uniref:CCHC-type domain-containing protein n=1 Tax=Rhipicephalus microplus TaxID=6941 RepID=A0A9J6D217_RHIMP|nr:hypothetical protein HPB51_026824 [Rhipicephalus microplus]